MVQANQPDEPLVIRSCSGSAKLELSNRRPVNSPDPVESFYATLSTEGLRASNRVETPPSFAGPEGLAKLFEDMALNWRGWVGEKGWGSLEGEIAISCTSDKLGHITLAIRTWDYAEGWRASGNVVIEAGQLDSIAHSVREFLRT